MATPVENLAEWSQRRLQDLINNHAEESVYLDFKAADSLTDGKKKDIRKDVSAFANSDGGVIIYGISEVDQRADSFSFVDGSKVTKEWLEQVINDGIQRRIDGIRIHPVRFDDDLKKTVFVVEIPVSPFVPHMTNENRFYRRFNFMSVPMEEYEVRNSYHRKQEVKLELGEVSVTRVIGDKAMVKEGSFAYKVEINLANIGKIPAMNYRLKAYFSDSLSILTFDVADVSNTTDLLGGSMANLVSPTIFPGEELKVLSFEFGLSYETKHPTIPLHFYIYTETGYYDIVFDIADKVTLIQEEGLIALNKSQKEHVEAMRALINYLH